MMPLVISNVYFVFLFFSGIIFIICPSSFFQKEKIKQASVAREAMGLIEYWGNLTIAGLLLMPPTRHNFVHLNEALKVKKKCQ